LPTFAGAKKGKKTRRIKAIAIKARERKKVGKKKKHP